jgi:endonuclease/exonuclease/phosphatase family metal-dependent hydrolase
MEYKPVPANPWLFALIALMFINLAACRDDDSSLQPVEKNSAVELRVMTFNIEYGGTHVSFDNVIEAIRKADADIVGIQEADGNLQRLATELGWHYDLRNYVVSRFPLINPSGADGKYVYIEIEPGMVVALANVHLPSDPYGPYAFRDGATPNEVLQLEKTTRLPEMLAYLSTLTPLVKSNMPVFITGDFNAPPHTDRTLNAIGEKITFAWPVSLAIASAGFQDSWRTIYPDAAANPGFTWWAARPPLEVYEIDENEPQDRIDFIWFSGAAAVQSSEIVGEQEGPEVSVHIEPWPSDHRAVVSQFQVNPVALPAMVSTSSRIYQIGEDVEVRYQTSGEDNTLSVIGDGWDDAMMPVFKVVNSGRWLISPHHVKPGHYRVLLENNNSRIVLENEFWVVPEDANPALSINKNKFRTGEPIDIEWHSGPGNRNDYIAIYPTDIEPNYDNELPWAYLGALPAGKLQLDDASAEAGWPLQPGTYLVRMLKDDGLEQLAESSYFIVE